MTFQVIMAVRIKTYRRHIFSPYGWYISTKLRGGHVSGDKNLIQFDSCKYLCEVSTSFVPNHTTSNVEDEHKLSLKYCILFKSKNRYKFGTLKH